jgi:hypothetical protein
VKQGYVVPRLITCSIVTPPEGSYSTRSAMAGGRFASPFGPRSAAGAGVLVFDRCSTAEKSWFGAAVRHSSRRTRWRGWLQMTAGQLSWALRTAPVCIHVTVLPVRVMSVRNGPTSALLEVISSRVWMPELSFAMMLSSRQSK